jgi:hypothetical protein
MNSKLRYSEVYTYTALRYEYLHGAGTLKYLIESFYSVRLATQGMTCHAC